MSRFFELKVIARYLLYLAVLLAAAYLVYRFMFILAWILGAAVVSFIGQPLADFFGRLHVYKLKLPRAAASAMALVVILIAALSLIGIFVPLIVQQVRTLSGIDWNHFAASLAQPMGQINDWAVEYGLVPEGGSLQEIITHKIKSLLDFESITNVLGGVFGAAGNVFMALASVMFIAFFFIKDENMFEKALLLTLPENQHKPVSDIIDGSKKILKRYFLGVMLELLSVMSLISLILWIFGIENALLIGFFGGLMNIIPYLGPLIGTALGLLLGFTSVVATGNTTNLWTDLLTIAGVMTAVNYVDNLLLQPLIFSNSIKAHPLEIFFVIIIGGTLGGIAGMLLAIPVYTVLRLIARQYLGNFRLVRKITEDI